MLFRSFKEKLANREEKAVEAEQAAQQFHQWYQHKNHPSNLSLKNSFDIWFYEIDQKKKSNSRYARVLSEVKKIKNENKQVYRFDSEFTDGEYAQSIMFNAAKDEFLEWHKSHAITYSEGRQLNNFTADENFQFWFATYYSKYTNSNCNFYNKVVDYINAENSFSLKNISKDEFKSVAKSLKEERNQSSITLDPTVSMLSHN